jgi:foldase protein PrsA
VGLAVLLVITLVVFGIVTNVDKIAGLFKGDVAARVNGQAITWKDIDKKYALLSDSAKSYMTKDILLNQTITEMVIKQEVAKKNILIDDAYLQAMVNNIKNQFPDEKTFNDTLAQQGISYSDLVDQLALSLKLNKMLQLDLPELRVNESEIEAFFAANKDSLSTPEQVSASHILVNSSEEADKIEALLKDGADFSELAKNYSLDKASAVYGGSLGYFSKGMMIKEFEDAAFALKIGEISEPVQTKYGYHIIMLTGKKAAKEAMLDDDTKALIELNLFNNKWDLNKEKVNSYILVLRNAAKIELVN